MSEQIEFIGTVTMTPAEWALVEDCPIQRDTERHARNADHLKKAHPAQAKVNMARLPNGRQIKLDGHTRSYLWSNGSASLAPPTLYVDVWRCAAMDDVEGLYKTFDNKAAVETATDQLSGAVRKFEVAFESPLLRKLRFTAALRHAHAMMFTHTVGRSESLYEIFGYWLPELRLLDACGPTSNRFDTGVIVAALITFRRYGPEAEEFWRSYASGSGTKIGGEMDAVQALEERMERRRSQQRTFGLANVQDTVAIALSAFGRFKRNEICSAAKGGGLKALGNDAIKHWLRRAAATDRDW